MIPEQVAPVSHLRIAIPAYTGDISVQTMHSLSTGIRPLREAGLMVDTDFLAGCCYLDHVRNMLVERFLQSEATDLLFVDADVGFPPDAVLRIVSSSRPVVAGIYPKKTDDPDDWPVALDVPEIWADRTGHIECAMVPTGFMRIHRSVFEAMRPHVQRYEYINGSASAFFRTEIIDGIYYGEDAWFCRKWRELGGKVFAIAELQFEHVGKKTWRGKWPPTEPQLMEKAA